MRPMITMARVTIATMIVDEPGRHGRRGCYCFSSPSAVRIGVMSINDRSSRRSST
jgi:hypothetical protein